MTSEPILIFQNVSKRYRSRSGRSALKSFIAKAPEEDACALEDVSFQIHEGESVALIGNNGAGKTTALRIATGVTVPTTGVAKCRGKIGALIEVGTGIHPELTGRENIFIYGSILGMSRREIRGRFEEIVEFSGLEKVLDQQVKFYSSGMHLRLGFSIAAHTRPELLVVDEALAVGDLAYQTRCIAKMRSMLRDGVTLLFVSHQYPIVESLCSRGLMFEKGRIVSDGSIHKVIEKHIQSSRSENDLQPCFDTEGWPIHLVDVQLRDRTGKMCSTFNPKDSLQLTICVRVPERQAQPRVIVGITAGGDMPIGTCSMMNSARLHSCGQSDEWIYQLDLFDLPLRSGRYELWFDAFDASGEIRYSPWMKIANFEIVEPLNDGLRAASELVIGGPVVFEHEWIVDAEDK